MKTTRVLLIAASIVGIGLLARRLSGTTAEDETDPEA